MSSVVFFNPALKESYLNEKYSNVDKGTKSHPVVRLFSISQELEQYLEKDLSQFNLRELEKLFYMSRPSTVIASENFVSQASSYIDWVNKKFNSGKANPLLATDIGWKRQFGIHLGKSLFTITDIHKLVQDIPEPQISVVVILLFNGIQGKNLSELTNLRERDVNYKTKELTLTDFDESKRIVKVSQLCLDIIKKAINATEYANLNIHNSDKKKRISKLPEDTDLVIRKGVTAATKDYRVNAVLLHKRLEDVQKHYNLPNLIPHNLVRSGILAYAMGLYLESNKIFNNNLLQKVFEHFNISDYQERMRATKNFLNEDTLIKTYRLRSK